MRLLNIGDLMRYRKCPRAFYLGLKDVMSTEPERILLSGEAAYAIRDLSYKHFFHMRRECDGMEVNVDLLMATPEGWEIVFDTNALYIRESHVWEAALMIRALKKAGCKVAYVTALCLRGGYICDETPDYNDMYYEVDLTRRALAKCQQLPRLITEMTGMAEADDVIEAIEANPAPLDEACLKPRECPWWNKCKSLLPQPNVFSISGINHAVKFDLYKRGIISYEDCLTANVLPAAQKQQIIFEMEKREPLINYPAVSKFLKSLWYPMAFLDFESWQPPIPRFEGMRPFEQSAFLYSLHVKRSPEAGLEHYDTFVRPGDDPRRPIAEGLVSQIPEGACVIVYSSGLEKQVLRTLGERFKDLRPVLGKHYSAVRDLLSVFRTKDYYDWRMRGSCSLKRVYPAFLLDDDLDYTELDQVQNGEEAMYTYMRMANMTDEEADEYEKRLRDYCALDTYAMYRIVCGLEKAVSERKKKENDK